MSAVIAGLIAGYRSVLRLILVLLRYFYKGVRGPKTLQIISEFCAEAAVLIAVFPVLDTIVESRRIQYTATAGNPVPQAEMYGATWSIGIWSAVISIILLLIAIIIKGEGRGEDREG
jgi:hypothetical protein